MMMNPQSPKSTVLGLLAYYKHSSVVETPPEITRTEKPSGDYSPDRVLVSFTPGSVRGVTITHEGNLDEEDGVWANLLRDIMLCGISHLNGTPHPSLKPYSGPLGEDGNRLKQTEHPDEQ